MSKYYGHSARVVYSRRWKALRSQALRRDGFRCRTCDARGRLEVDHVLPVRDRPDLAWDLGNLQSLCPPCHTRKTRLQAGHDPILRDLFGDLTPSASR